MQKCNAALTNKNNIMLRGPSWAAEDGRKNLITTKPDDGELSLGNLNKLSGHSSSSGFQGSFSSFGSSLRDFVDSAIVSLKENVDAEKLPSHEETLRDAVVRFEKNAQVSHLMEDDEFRRFKKEMHDNGVVTSVAISQNISKSVAKRASMQ